jgi:sortase A
MMRQKWLNGFLTCGMVACLALSLGAFLYPSLANVFNDWQASRLIAHSNSQRKSMAELKAQMDKQQAALKAKALEDPYSEASIQALKFDPITTDIYVQHIIGEIYLPTIKQHLPIFDNVGEQFLQRGAAWLATSSKLTGGIGSHSAVSAHSGIPGSKLFNDLQDLKLGDLIIYKLADEYLAYRIESKVAVKPSETKAYAKNTEKDLTTLITCTPIGINSHRLLVTGERVPFEPAMMKLVKQATAAKESQDRWVLILVGLGIVVVSVSLVWRIKQVKARKRKQSNAKPKEKV